MNSTKHPASRALPARRANSPALLQTAASSSRGSILRSLSLGAFAWGLASTLTGVASAQINVACVGDSITAGVGASSGNSYPTQLGKLLGSGYKVSNFGHSGATLMSNGNLPYINQTEYTNSSNSSPAIVVIMLGTNDAKDSNWANHSTFTSDYDALIAHYRGLPTHPIVCVMTPPTMYSTGFGGSSTTTLNNTIVPLEEQIANDNVAPIIDVHTATANHSEWFAADSSHVHPNDAGAAAIAQTVYMEIAYLTASTSLFEGENLTVAAQTAGVTVRSVADAAFSNGNGLFFDATAASQFITLDVPNLAAATYDVGLGVKAWNNKGTFQLAISRLDNQGSPANVGSPVDTYTANSIYPDIELGSWAPGTTSDKAVRFMITGKNASSTGYGIAVDYLRFIKQPTGGSLTASVAAGSTSPYNLTTLGTSDWAHWNSSYIHKSSGGGKISNVTQIGGGTYGVGTSTARNVSWSDGTPTGSGSSDNSYIWCDNTQDAGWTFTVPADTTSRTLNVLFSGTVGASVTLSAHLSDRSAPDVANTETISTTTLSVGTFTYHAASAGQTLTVTFIKVADHNSPSADLDAAWLQ